ncbi:MAG: head-tail connector protein [Thiolinea sp.]
MLRLITPPTVEPVTVTELATNLNRFIPTDEQSEYADYDVGFMAALISAAREDAEHYTGRYWAVQTLEKTFRDFDKTLSLTPTLRSISSVNYWDQEDTERAFPTTDYLPAFGNFCGGIEFRDPYAFPSVAQRSDAVNIRFEVGPYHTPATVKQAILLIASHWYENREAANITGGGLEIREVPFAYRWLLDSHRIPVVG